MYWDPAGLLAEQVWRLAVQGVRGFRLGAGLSVASCPLSVVNPETSEVLTTDKEQDEPFALVAGGVRDSAARQIESRSVTVQPSEQKEARKAVNLAGI